MYLDVTECIGCGGCRLMCKWNALREAPDGTMRLDAVRCRDCGACIEACPTGALRRGPTREEVRR
ncbi:MAG: 4Fe-4S binding protein [Phycisphaerae bacterium]